MESSLEGKGWRRWYELGLRQEGGSALGAALGSFEKALELNPANTEIAEARIRVAKHFTHIEKYRKLIHPDEWSGLLFFKNQISIKLPCFFL